MVTPNPPKAHCWSNEPIPFIAMSKKIFRSFRHFRDFRNTKKIRGGNIENFRSFRHFRYFRDTKKRYV